MLTARTKTIERTGTGRQFPPSLASLSATKFSLQIYMELAVQATSSPPCWMKFTKDFPYLHSNFIQDGEILFVFPIP